MAEPSKKALDLARSWFHPDTQMPLHEGLAMVFDGLAIEARNAALEEAAVIAERIRACPFDKGAPRHNLGPEDPCPVCGDLGTWPSLDEGSKCLTAATEIRALKTTT